MTKDNAKRVQKVIGKFVERLEWSTSSLADWAQEMLCGYVLVLVNKAERRGAENAQGEVMGKTNENRVFKYGAVLGNFFISKGARISFCDMDWLHATLKKWIDKAERRGRRKEHQEWMRRINDVPLTPLVIENLTGCHPQPPFDVEKVKGWLLNIQSIMNSHLDTLDDDGAGATFSFSTLMLLHIAQRTRFILKELGIDE